MLSGWDPYAAIVGAVLDGANPSGRPFAAVDFGRTGVPGAVATLVEDPSGAVAIVVDRRHTSDLPEHLLPVVVHETLHGGGDNSRQEEIIANVLDTVAYAQVLLVAPDVAAGTQLAVYNNAALLALLNSTGAAGPARLGITASPRGDVWLGPDLDRVDAASLTDAISGDDYYQALPATGSPGPPAFAALLRPFPGGAALGPDPRFDDAALALVDRGVGVVVPPADALRLARTLGLALTDVVAPAASSWPRTPSGPRPGYSP